jgi:hypothetical protein
MLAMLAQLTLRKTKNRTLTFVVQWYPYSGTQQIKRIISQLQPAKHRHCQPAHSGLPINILCHVFAQVYLEEA